MPLEVRISLKPTLAKTIRAAEERLKDACDMFVRRGWDRRLIRIHGARTEREAPSGSVVLVWRVWRESASFGDVWEQRPTGRLHG